MIRFVRRIAFAVALLCSGTLAFAQPSEVAHTPAANAYNPVVGTSTQRNPAQPRENETVTIYFRVCCQFTYNNVAIYYTTDGSEPSGSFGGGLGGTTQLLTGGSIGGAIQFHANQTIGPSTYDWWRVDLPAPSRNFNQTIKYKISAWKPFVGAEVFANGGASYSYRVDLAWPGQGSNFTGSEGVGYPPVYFWKEEAMVGNGYLNAMLDRNGSWYDLIYPGTGFANGVGSANEGYADGLDTFPPGTSGRGQMHLSTAMVGLRVDGVTSWLSNQNGNDFGSVQQSYVADTNVVSTSQVYVRNGNNIALQQYDFTPDGTAFALDANSAPLRATTLKRLILTNRGPAAKTVNVYLYLDPALNGGGNFDFMYTDPARGAMIAYDNAGGTALSRGEYNPRSDGIDYPKNVSVYLAGAMKAVGTPGASGGAPAADSWRDTSADNGQGWIGTQVVLQPNVPYEIDFTLTGGYDNFAGATGTYNFQMAPVIDWFLSGSAATVQTDTQNYWLNWLASGTTLVSPDPNFDALFKRSLLASEIHYDRKSGGMVAGYHNGAYYAVWPRDAAWAGITFLKSGHFDEAKGITNWMRDVAYRDVENWGDGARKGYWKQKYTTDGYVVWYAAQVDETAVAPWLVNTYFNASNDAAYLSAYYPMCYDAGLAMTRTSINAPSRLNFQPAVNLMFSNNIWEDSNDTFVFSNANIWRGLLDLKQMATRLGFAGDASTWNALATTFENGVRGRLAWDGENTDISFLGICYPFEVISPTDPLAAHAVDRMNGVATDRFGNNHAIMNFDTPTNQTNNWVGLLNRYYGDTYWNGGPWFLATMWYGGYYAMRSDYTPNTADIDNHKLRLDLIKPHNGAAGFGAEQVAPANSLLYPGQSDFSLQAAWPNAWESMSFYADAILMFLDYHPDSPGNTLRIKPKLPSAWASMTFKNVRLGNDVASPSHNHSFDVTIDNSDFWRKRHVIVNNTGNAANFSTVIRVPVPVPSFAGTLCSVYVNGVLTAPTFVDYTNGRVGVDGAIQSGVGAITRIEVVVDNRADWDQNGELNPVDLLTFLNRYFTDADGHGSALPGPGFYAVPCSGAQLSAVPPVVTPAGLIADFNGDCQLDSTDLLGYLQAYFTECPSLGPTAPTAPTEVAPPQPQGPSRGSSGAIQPVSTRKAGQTAVPAAKR